MKRKRDPCQTRNHLERFMTPHEANLRAISLCAAFLIALLGLTHEVVGPTLFPWAPA